MPDTISDSSTIVIRVHRDTLLQLRRQCLSLNDTIERILDMPRTSDLRRIQKEAVVSTPTLPLNST